ncbi:MAG: hypothetical protein EZS28_001606 [Streblomastix strix]|uniref:Uncharacterized protein n=1 Tax=Streblomastix strix TaxID=222440 RepID=A0A5J4X6G2_9EUKA|nr:MAG: hypothetical protein EZS28_001606 [Streblomastix strix]
MSPQSTQFSPISASLILPSSIRHSPNISYQQKSSLINIHPALLSQPTHAPSFATFLNGLQLPPSPTLIPALTQSAIQSISSSPLSFLFSPPHPDTLVAMVLSSTVLSTALATFSQSSSSSSGAAAAQSLSSLNSLLTQAAPFYNPGAGSCGINRSGVGGLTADANESGHLAGIRTIQGIFAQQID